MRRHLLGLLKVSLSLGILAFLFYQAQQNDVFTDLWDRPKNWWMLSASALICLIAVLATLLRWHLLIRALGIPHTVQETLRLGFLGYLLNLAPMGIVGGDLLKALALVHRQRDRRAEALATVVVDRAVGMCVLFLVASAAIVVTGFWKVPIASVQIASRITLTLAAVTCGAMLVMLGPDVTNGRFIAFAGRAPGFGPPLRRLIEAIRLYRHKLPTLLAATLISAVVHSLFALGVYLIAAGLYRPVHPLGTHFVLVPISAATGVIPLTVGPFEAVLNLLYADVPLPDGGHMAAGQGLVVALGYRMVSVLIAAIGLVYYLAARKEVSDLIHEAEAETDT